MLLDEDILNKSKENEKQMREILLNAGENLEETVIYGSARVKCAQISNLTLEAKVRSHAVRIDEPERGGGADTAPTPVELMLAALGGCMEINWVFLCSMSKLDVKSVEIEVTGKWDRRYILGGPKAPKAKLSEVQLDIFIETEEFPKKFDRILQKSIDMCPVGGSLDVSIKKEYILHFNKK